MSPRILVAFNFSAAAQRALAWAVDLHHSLSGSSLMLVHVVRPSVLSDGLTVPYVPSAGWDLETVEDAVRRTAAIFGAEPWVRTVLAANAGEAILTTAASVRAELLVIGTSERGSAARFVLGSVTDEVLRKASCPVVAVQAKHT